jgi:hypothetical protein
MLKLWRLVTFEPLWVEQSYIPLLKGLMCGINASGAQGRDSTLSICHALLKNAILLSEIAKRLTFIFGNCNYPEDHGGVKPPFVGPKTKTSEKLDQN